MPSPWGPPPTGVPPITDQVCPPHHWIILSEEITHQDNHAVGTQHGRCLRCAEERDFPVDTILTKVRYRPPTRYERADFKDWLSEADGGSYIDE